MMGKSAREGLAILAAGLLLWSSGTPVAQSQTPVKKEEPAAPPFPFSELMKRVENLYMVRLSDTVGLSPEQSAQVAATIRRAQQARQALLNDRGRILRELDALLAEKSPPERLQAKVAEWQVNETRLGRWRQDLYNELEKVLSLEQRARYLLYDEGFNRDIRKVIMDMSLKPPSAPQN